MHKEIYTPCLTKIMYHNNFTTSYYNFNISAEVVTRVASSLEAGGLPGYPEVLFVEEVLTKLCSTLFYTIIEDAMS